MLTPFDLDRIGAGLPFAESVPELERALRGGVAVVQAPPGTGKTTVVPPVVANLVLAESGSTASPAETADPTGPADVDDHGAHASSATAGAPGAAGRSRILVVSFKC